MSQKARIAGWAYSSLGTKLGKSPSVLVKEALGGALQRAGLEMGQVDGFLACPALADSRFMWAHHLATECGVFAAGKRRVHVATVDNGGASPISMLLLARALVEAGQCSAVAVVAGDSISSLDPKEFQARALASMHTPHTHSPPDHLAALPPPPIPHAYAKCAVAQMSRQALTREQLAMVSVLMSAQASFHPLALQRTPYTLQQVLGAAEVAPVTGMLECARKSDGAAAVLVTNAAFSSAPISILGGAEAAGSIGVAKDPGVLLESISSASAAFQAAYAAYADAGVTCDEISYFGLYDCFPICFVRAVEAAQLAPVGGGGQWVEDKYERWMRSQAAGERLSAGDMPVNTHGGLLAFGAPWEVPALFSLVEACQQLAGEAVEGGRQVVGCERAAVYGNGGVFNASAVAILQAVGKQGGSARGEAAAATTGDRTLSFMERLQQERRKHPQDLDL